jgi:hypothetical protein
LVIEISIRFNGSSDHLTKNRVQRYFQVNARIYLIMSPDIRVDSFVYIGEKIVKVPGLIIAANYQLFPFSKELADGL